MQLSDEQKQIITSQKDDNLTLAGPGTGKSTTILGEIQDLVQVKKVDPKRIFVLTFTRAAKADLEHKIEEEFKKEFELPNVFTLHGFALRQLLKNSSKISSLPKDFEIANDFEERWIIIEDIKRIMNVSHVKEVRDLFHRLSANWETLNADKKDWEVAFDNPSFIGAWQEHRSTYGYVLRAELVYQLKKVLEQGDNILLDGPIEYLIVDEYQDLNRCDLALIQHLHKKGAKLFCAGDDDQSIYAFRYAFPEGIRNFEKDYDKSIQHSLSECWRCDKAILDLGMQVIRQDNTRIPKTIKPISTVPGEVHLLKFPREIAEAKKVASLITTLRDSKSVSEKEVIVLLRSDHRRAFSSLLEAELTNAGVKVNKSTQKSDLLQTETGRIFISLAKYITQPNNDLALREILELIKGFGSVTCDSIYGEAVKRKMRFSQVIELVRQGQQIGITNEKKVKEIMGELSTLKDLVQADGKTIDDKIGAIFAFISNLSDDVKNLVVNLVAENGITELPKLVALIDAILSPIEAPDSQAEGVRIMSMHKAKGLSAKAVFVVAAEDEYLPGKNGVEEERRLLYVSLTRAKHYLFVTYCNDRHGAQQYTGFLSSPTTSRSLTRFLRDLPILKAVDGNSFILT